MLGEIMKHIMRLNSEPFKMIKSGIKTIELRLYDEKRSKIRVGDEIEFLLATDESLRCSCTVRRLYRFSSFEELYGALPLLKCGYTEKDIEAAHYTDMEKYYSREKQKEYGVVGIEIELL